MNASRERLFAGIFLGLSLLGFLDASYLALKHWQGEVPPCTIIQGCEQVTTSVYSEIFGIPVALLGALNYLVIFFAAIFYFDSKNSRVLRLIAGYTAVGLAFSLWFTYAQAFLIKSWCQYCLFSALTSTALFVAGVIFLAKKEKVALPE